MDTNQAFTDGERALMRREGQRLVDVVTGRADRQTQVCHYLIIERPGHPFVDPREIEQHRDLERVYANAKDCETGARVAKCLGAFTATYKNGKLESVAVIGLDKPPAFEVPPRKVRNVLTEAQGWHR